LMYSSPSARRTRGCGRVRASMNLESVVRPIPSLSASARRDVRSDWSRAHSRSTSSGTALCSFMAAPPPACSAGASADPTRPAHP
jgi:hypothetical protein